MSGESHNVDPSGHPDLRLIAAHADRQLAGAEAARLDEHIARCSECYEVFSETVQFGLAEAPPSVSVRRPAFGRPAFKMAAGLAAAAVLVLAIGLWQQRTRFQRGPAAPLAQLVQAMGTRRFVEPRLTGGFRHGRLITLRAGDTPQGLDAQSPAVLAAVARVREQAEGDTSPEALGALGITYLVSGDPAAAVKTLESASAQKPDDPRLLSDLAAAYLVRAAQADEPADIPKALEMAERAIALKDAPTEAWFNRALALERLHLVDAARKAWGDYLERDSTSGWADEARQHLEALPKAQQSSVEEDKARVRAALQQGASAIDRLADEEPSVLRDYFEDELLPAWADAHLVGHPDAKLHRERARLVGEALFRTTGDALARDAARALVDTPASATSRVPLRSQATGYMAFREAKRLYGLQQPACSPFRVALRDLEAGGSPYAAWAALQVVITCLFPSEQQAALTELSRLEAVAADGAYAQVLGRVQYMQGLIVGLRGDLTDSQERLRSARASFKKTQDAETEAWVLVKMAENLTFVGDGRAGWSDRVAALALLGHVRSPQRRYGILGEALTTCLDEHTPRPALHFANAAVDVAKTSLSWATSDAILRRAAVHHSLGADDAAVAEVLESRRWIARIADKSLSESLAAEADAVEGEILVRTDPERATHRLRQAIAHYQGIAPVRVPALHVLLARARLVSGSDDAAESELLAGIEAMERGRISLGHADQVSFFDQALPLFVDMVRFQVAKRRDFDRALAFVERGRARQLVDSLAGAVVRPLDPDALRRELPDGLALVYYVSLDDRLFAWALDREGSHFIERPLRAADLSRLVAANRAAIEGRATPEVVRRTSAGLHDELVRPLLPFIASQRALILIPDGTLQSVAFASLWDRQRGHYLVEDYLLGVAASGTTFVRTSTRAATPFGTSPRALVVGNPQIDRRLWVGMPNLPGAEAEAVGIAALYPRSELLSGAAATKAAFLQRARNSQVIHFAGHAAASADAPSAARLLFARDPATGDSGALYLHELGRLSFPRTRVVVLGACRSAAGAISRVEGALSLGRPFLAAGVPDVVGSLWDIDDDVSRRFFVAFHRALLVEGDPLTALRKAQIAFLKGDDPSLVHPASWAPFICMGGLDPHSLSKGEVS